MYQATKTGIGKLNNHMKRMVENRFSKITRDNTPNKRILSKRPPKSRADGWTSLWQESQIKEAEKSVVLTGQNVKRRNEKFLIEEQSES